MYIYHDLAPTIASTGCSIERIINKTLMANPILLRVLLHEISPFAVREMLVFSSQLLRHYRAVVVATSWSRASEMLMKLLTFGLRFTVTEVQWR